MSRDRYPIQNPDFVYVLQPIASDEYRKDWKGRICSSPTMSRCKSMARKESDKEPPKKLEMKEKLTKTELKESKGKKII